MAWAEATVDDAEVAADIEATLPTGGRPRQLRVRTLLVGILLAIADGRPAHLVRVHRALVALPAPARRRLGVVVEWASGAHVLTYRQVERTFSLVVEALSDGVSDGTPGDRLAAVIDALMEASIPEARRSVTTALAVDWTDHASWSRPGDERDPAADPDASWGHRRPNTPGARHETFFGYYAQVATMVAEEGAPAVPELVRRVVLSSAHADPPRVLVPVLARMHAAGIRLGDVLADSGYAHRAASAWALPLRAMGAALVTDLHPHDRGPKGTFAGAVIANGRLWCPATPVSLLEISPLPPNADAAAAAAHDDATAELARYKLGRISADDADGYHRVACPAVGNKLRCALRPASVTLPLDRPEVLTPPASPPRCCVQATVTVPPEVNAMTAQKHDYPSAAHRRSYRRRTAAERAIATVKDPAATDMGRGWCRVMGLTAITLFLACAFVARNKRIVDAFEVRQDEDARRAAAGQPPRSRRRRRRGISDLIAAASL